MNLLDFLFPKRCVGCNKFGSYICSHCFTYISFTDGMVCVVCQRAAVDGITHPSCRTRYGIEGVFPSLVYIGIVKKLIYKFKYPPYLSDLQKIMTELFYEGLIQKEEFYKQFSSDSILVPVPLHSSKYRSRGYNQAQKLAEGLSQKFELQVVNCLVRVKNTKTQVGLSKKEREENIKGAFAVKEEFVEQMKITKQVFLVDDVATSGATLKESGIVIKRKGVKRVWGITLAHGQ